jgi:hypothetical protein
MEPPQPTGMGEFSRLTGVFFEPGKTFEDIGRRPRWLVPLALLIVVTLAYYFFYSQHVGWARFMQHQLETSARMQQQFSQMPPDQREQAMAMQSKIMGISYYIGTIIMTPVMFLISAGILLGLVSGIMHSGLKFKQVFAIVCYAALPGVIKQVLAIGVMFLKNPDDFNLMNPLAFNPAAFMDPLNSSKFAYTLASSIDLFAIWGLLLTAIGLKAVAGKRLSFGGAVFAVVVPWALLVLFGASMAGMFG